MTEQQPADTGLQVFYTDHGLMLGYPPDPKDTTLLRAVAFPIDDALGLAGALKDCAATGTPHPHQAYAVAPGPDEHVALMWMEGDVIQVILIPRDQIGRLCYAMWESSDRRDVLVIHDAAIADADPDDFKRPKGRK